MSFLPSANAVRKEIILGMISGAASLATIIVIKKWLASREKAQG